MARLKILAPRLERLAPLVGFAPGDERAADRHRAASTPWRAWYGSARWRLLRQAALVRDGWRCRQTGVMCVGKAPAPDSPVVDHVTPHRGDPALFWSLDNLQTVAKAWHDAIKQAEERAFD